MPHSPQPLPLRTSLSAFSSVVVSDGCCNKLLETYWVITTLVFNSLEARSTVHRRSRCHQDPGCNHICKMPLATEDASVEKTGRFLSLRPLFDLLWASPHESSLSSEKFLSGDFTEADNCLDLPGTPGANRTFIVKTRNYQANQSK